MEARKPWSRGPAKHGGQTWFWRFHGSNLCESTSPLAASRGLFTPGDHFDNCRRSDPIAAEAAAWKNGQKKAVSVSLGPGCRFVGGTSRLRPRPDRSGLSLDETMTSTTVRPSGCQRRNRASNKIRRLGGVQCWWGPPPHGAGQWSWAFFHSAALGCSGPADPGGQNHRVQHLRRLQCQKAVVLFPLRRACDS